MHWRFSFTAVCFALLLAVGIVVPGASAQDIFVTPVPNAPFSGVVKVERSRVMGDGSVIGLRNIREIGRDSRGRIHNESRAAVPALSNETPQLLRVHLYDPQTRISTYLDPQNRTFWTQTTNHPPSTEPPTLRFASPPGEGSPNEFAKEEDLGIHEIEGVSAHGVRQTQTIPAESSGTGAEVVIADEYWYSGDLRIDLMIKHSDPRTGSVTMTVTQIARTEPDPAMFEIPEGYRPPKGAKGSE
jgi:hypothetical protein